MASKPNSESVVSKLEILAILRPEVHDPKTGSYDWILEVTTETGSMVPKPEVTLLVINLEYRQN
jgi:hypothetical protein